MVISHLSPTGHKRRRAIFSARVAPTRGVYESDHTGCHLCGSVAICGEGTAARFMNSPLPLSPARTENICFFLISSSKSHCSSLVCIAFRVTPIYPELSCSIVAVNFNFISAAFQLHLTCVNFLCTAGTLSPGTGIFWCQR